MSRAPVATPPGIVELSSESARVAFVPAQGGRIIALVLGGRQWLADGDRGGITECFPTIAGCTISSGIPSLGGHALPAGGEIAARAPSFTMETHDPDEGAAALRAVTEWTGERAPWRYTRELRVVADAVVMRYSLANEGREKLPFLWGARAVLPLGRRRRSSFPTAPARASARSRGSTCSAWAPSIAGQSCGAPRRLWISRSPTPSRESFPARYSWTSRRVARR